MKKFVRKHSLTIIGLIVGAIGGFIYWKFVGCLSGTCAITSNPIMMTLYGSIMGAWIFSFIQKEQKSTI